MTNRPSRREQRCVVEILSRDYWFKPLENQQINWCLVDDNLSTGCSTAFFFHELSSVFDRLTFVTQSEADRALRHNGFHRLADCPEVDQNAVPGPPFQEDEHWNGPIYSSGRFWRAPPDLSST